MEKLTIEQLKELLEFHYEYDDLVTIRNHIECVIENIDNGNYDAVSDEKIYEQEMDNMKFCGCGCILAKNEYKCSNSSYFSSNGAGLVVTVKNLGCENRKVKHLFDKE